MVFKTYFQTFTQLFGRLGHSEKWLSKEYAILSSRVENFSIKFEQLSSKKHFVLKNHSFFLKNAINNELNRIDCAFTV